MEDAAEIQDADDDIIPPTRNFDTQRERCLQRRSGGHGSRKRRIGRGRLREAGQANPRAGA